MSLIPNTPIVNQPYLIGDGLAVTYLTNTTLSVGAGGHRDSTNRNDIKLDSTLALNTATIGANGLDVGTLAQGLYYLHVVGSSLQDISNPTSCILLSLSATDPVLPFGFDMFYCIGGIGIDSSLHILPFYATGEGSNKTYWYQAPQSILNAGASATFADVDASLLVPANSNVILDSIITPTAAGNTGTVVPDSLKATATGFVVVSGAVASVAQHAQVVCPCDSTAKLAYKVTGTLSLNVLGFSL